MSLRFAATAILLAACGSKPPPDKPVEPAVVNESPAGAPAKAGADLRRVDWQNRTYKIPSDDGDGVDLIAGEYPVVDGKQEWDRGDGDNGWFVAQEPSFGDVDGDGVDEAIVIVIANGGGSGAFSAALVYAAGDPGGEPRIVARIPGGDRGAGGLRAVEVVEPGTLKVVRNWLADGEGALNPSLIRVERWRWDGGKLVEDEAAREQKPDTE